MRETVFLIEIGSRITLPNRKTIEIVPSRHVLGSKIGQKRLSRHVLASKIGQNHAPITFGVLLLAQSWARGVPAPSFGASERPPKPPKTWLFLKETTTFPLCAPHRFGAAQGAQLGPHWNPLCSSAPCPISPKSTLPNPTFHHLSFRTPGRHLPPTPDPSRGRRTQKGCALCRRPRKKNVLSKSAFKSQPSKSTAALGLYSSNNCLSIHRSRFPCFQFHVSTFHVSCALFSFSMFHGFIVMFSNLKSRILNSESRIMHLNLYINFLFSRFHVSCVVDM